jgi:sugar lactone lactonase YvrE
MSARRLNARTLARCWYASGVLLVLAALMATSMPALAAQPGNQSFQRTWQRTDQPVLDGLIARTWMWGPEANTTVLQEPYAEAPDGMRVVQYYDKSRMEITNPAADANLIWYVTNGLLVVELITGQMQTGDNAFEGRLPAAVNVAGDYDDPTGPTYATFGDLLDAAPRAAGSTITERVNREAVVSDDQSLANQSVTVALVDEVTQHAIADPFWTFMTSSGPIDENGQVISAPLFENPYFATGRPITEAYWAEVKVGGQYRDVLMQCFERRCLTYTPGNPEGFIVEAGNVGQHYYSWRYGDEGGEPMPPAGEPPAEEPPTEEPPVTPDPATRYQFAGIFGAPAPSGAELVNPTGAAVAPNGNIYVVDGGDRVQVFSPQGIWLKSWGGTGAQPGQFDSPQGIEVDPDGNVYVADFANHRIQKFDPDGALITYWAVDGFPSDIAYSVEGDLLYVTDMNKHLVRKYSRNGVDNGSWGEYGSDPGQFFAPSGLAIGPDKNVYVADTVNNRVQVFSLAGEFKGMFGSGGTGPGQFNFPSDVVIATGSIVYEFKVYVADSLNDRIQVFSLDAVLAPVESRTLAALSFSYSGQLGATGVEPGQLLRPESLDLDQNGNLVIADMRNDRIQKLSLSGQALDVLSDASRARFTGDDLDLALGADGRLFVSDVYSLPQNGFDGAIQVFGPDGGFMTMWDGVLAVATTFDSQGNLIILNATTGRIEKYSPDGQLLDALGSENPGSRIITPRAALATDAQDNLYILSTSLGSIQKFSADGTYLDSWGAPGSQPGQLLSPYDFAIHGDEIFVADTSNHRVQVFDLNGAFLREWGGLGTGDGQFTEPQGIAVDGSGYVYVADSGNNRIQKFTPGGEFLAKWGGEGNGNGQFRSPQDIAVDAAGNVFVVDGDNYRIQKFEPVS